MRDVYDENLINSGDNRNVVNKYKNWKVESIKEDMAAKAFSYHVAIENFQHDFNIGTIVRNANAFNAGGVHIIGKRHWNRRGAMSTEKYLQVFNHSDITAFASWATKNDLIIIGVDNIESSTKLQKTTLPKNSVFVFGQEGPGLSLEMQNRCSSIVAIEQFGSTRSINVGVASGIIMYSWVKTWAM